MAGTGVLPFIRGIDLTLNNLGEDRFPECLSQMSSLRWIKLSSTQLEKLPSQIADLSKLEHLTLKRNNLNSLEHSTLKKLPCLRTLNLSRNSLEDLRDPDLFKESDDLNTLDLSHNRLKVVPEGIIKAKSLLVLNLSHNNLESIPSSLLMTCTDLLTLDASYNDLDALPPQLRRLQNLQNLNLSHNPLNHFQIRPLPSLTELRQLHMRNTQRNESNIPTNLEALIHLQDVDLRENQLTSIPEGLLTLPNMTRLNLGIFFT